MASTIKQKKIRCEINTEKLCVRVVKKIADGMILGGSMVLALKKIHCNSQSRLNAIHNVACCSLNVVLDS